MQTLEFLGEIIKKAHLLNYVLRHRSSLGFENYGALLSSQHFPLYLPHCQLQMEPAATALTDQGVGSFIFSNGNQALRTDFYDNTILSPENCNGG